MKKAICLSAAFGLALGAFAGASPKYVFVFIGDGMSTPQRMIAEDFCEKAGLPALAMNKLPYQVNTRTKSANAIITDSAAAGTAIACGIKTRNGALGVDAATNRVDSVAAVAKRKGMKVGVVTTVTVCHATPAAFYAHRPSRGMTYAIGLDLVESGFDYFCASGVYDCYNPTNDPFYKGDLRELAKKAGYTYIKDDKAAWAALKPGSKSWTAFGEYGLDFAIDANPSQPTPAEMVKKAIEVLDNPNGFFIMCEGGKVDYAGHANDAATNIRDLIALDDAVKAALEFRLRHPDETLIITTGDHETGGMSMGFAGCGGQFKVELLANQKISTEKFSENIKKLVYDRKGEITFDEVKPLVTEKFGLVFDPKAKGPLALTKTEIENLAKAFEADVAKVRAHVKDTTKHDQQRLYVFAQAVKNALNSHAGVGWSSGSHTALPTLTTAEGQGADILVGIKENSDLGSRLKALLAK